MFGCSTAFELAGKPCLAPAGDSLFFASPKKSKQKKGEPDSSALRFATGMLRYSQTPGCAETRALRSLKHLRPLSGVSCVAHLLITAVNFLNSLNSLNSPQRERERRGIAGKSNPPPLRQG